MPIVAGVGAVMVLAGKFPSWKNRRKIGSWIELMRID
jgi:hypothetical protein